MNCVDLEVAVSLIYREFMLMFPAESGFWEHLAREEEDHTLLYLAGDALKVIDKYAGIQLPPPAFIEKTLAFA